MCLLKQRKLYGVVLRTYSLHYNEKIFNKYSKILVSNVYFTLQHSIFRFFCCLDLFLFNQYPGFVKLKMCFIRVLNISLYCVKFQSELSLTNVLGFQKVASCCAED